jgi:hypothetical protein
MRLPFLIKNSLCMVLLFCGVSTYCHAQALETETARLIRAGSFEFSSSFEFQTSSEGKEGAVPFAFEYGITNRLELMIEPVPFTAIRPKMGRRATGPGDLEITCSYLLKLESGSFPALVVAVEGKYPTYKNSLITTGKTDYTGYLIASKQFGRFDTHTNLGYTIIGQPAGTSLKNIWDFALAGQYHVTDRYEIFGEVLGTTSSAPGEEGISSEENAVIPEAAGGELVGTLGAGTYIKSGLFLYFGVSYDNNNAVLFHPGMTVRF